MATYTTTYAGRNIRVTFTCNRLRQAGQFNYLIDGSILIEIQNGASFVSMPVTSVDNIDFYSESAGQTLKNEAIQRVKDELVERFPFIWNNIIPVMAERINWTDLDPELLN